MYNHLLVPIDDTDLSIDLVSNAVGLARAVGARVSFLHVIADPSQSARSDAELLRGVSRDDHAHAYDGKPRELLAKAEAAAHACGVPCTSLQRTGDEPATAIIDAARAAGCDLIFMASHGHRDRLGMALASETLDVLMHAGLPVLVSSAGNAKPPAHAIATIRDEHRSLAAVMHAWMSTLAAARQRGVGVDPAPMRDIVRYLQDFPFAQHHPTEEQLLFKRLRERTDDFNAELDELERQHGRDEERVAALAAQVEALTHGGEVDAAAATRKLDDAVRAYARLLWDHLGREEGVILPAAQQHLSDADWTEINCAFKTRRALSESGEVARAHRELFSRIVNRPQRRPS